MIFSKTKRRLKEKEDVAIKQKSFLVWLEIGVVDMNRAIAFYENVFYVEVEIRFLFDKKIGVFHKNGERLNICLIESEGPKENNAIKPTFFVDVIFETTKRVEKSGGKTISPSTLLRQKNEKGETIIGANLIDDQLGYITEVEDTEGNALLLYSHS
jgi:predicted enzyme related to lactoylglutathione lyase